MLRVLMLGWEFPPFISGGLGTACHGLTQAMNRLNVQVIFVLPKAADGPSNPARVNPRSSRVTFRQIRAPRRSPYPYACLPRDRPIAEPDLPTRVRYPLRVLGAGSGEGYGGNLMHKITRYANRCVELASEERYDLIHAHDWMTFPAGIQLAQRTGKPLIAHIHATEFDRSGEKINPQVYHIEKAGMTHAAQVIAVSHLTRKILIQRYNINPDKIRVVHNGIDFDSRVPSLALSPERRQPLVLFLGRLTQQKGPSFFLEAAQRVLNRCPRARFLVAGWGDLAPWMVEQVAEKNLAGRILFTGFLRGRDVDRAFQRAAVYVMPSVSEPFGLTALEAVRNHTPVILSKTSGVAEVLPTGSIKFDFWDTHLLADYILDLIEHPHKRTTLAQRAHHELQNLGWDGPANKTLSIYREQLDSVLVPSIAATH